MLQFLSLILSVTQAPGNVRLPPATTELFKAFTRISSVRELSDGRVLVLDEGDHQVWVVDLERQGIQPVGRQGAGPGEYRDPRWLLPISQDSTLLTDVRLLRSLTIGPDASFSGSPVPRPSGGLQLPSGVDQLGRLYLEGDHITEKAGQLPVPLDSAPLLRFTRASQRFDTLTWIKLPASQLSVSRRGNGVAVSLTTVSYISQDLWSVLPDGQVAVLRAKNYHLDLIGVDGRTMSGPPIPYTKVPLSEAERKRLSGKVLPDFKPPFEGPTYWGRTLLVAPDQRLWVRASAVAGDSIARYDILDLAGRLLASVSLPPNSRVAGFGRASLYIVRSDEDDLEYLSRLPLPRF